MNNKFVNLPNGSSIRASSIMALRLGEPRPKGEDDWEAELKPRVIVDFVVGDRGNSMVLDCTTIAQRDRLKDELQLLTEPDCTR